MKEIEILKENVHFAEQNSYCLYLIKLIEIVTPLLVK
jgi:hypothetical protein